MSTIKYIPPSHSFFSFFPYVGTKSNGKLEEVVLFIVDRIDNNKCSLYVCGCVFDISACVTFSLQ